MEINALCLSKKLEPVARLIKFQILILFKALTLSFKPLDAPALDSVALAWSVKIVIGGFDSLSKLITMWLS